jgi:hypothetical protein
VPIPQQDRCAATPVALLLLGGAQGPRPVFAVIAVRAVTVPFRVDQDLSDHIPDKAHQGDLRNIGLDLKSSGELGDGLADGRVGRMDGDGLGLHGVSPV